MFQFLACVICANSLAHGEDLDALIHNARFSRTAKERVEAVSAIGKLGEAGRPASKLLCERMVRDSAVAPSAGKALQKVNPKLYKPAVFLAGHNLNLKACWKAVAEIERLGDDGRGAVPLLFALRDEIRFSVEMKRVKEPRKELANLAILIARLGKDDPETTFTLIYWLSDPCADVRREVAKQIPFMAIGEDPKGKQKQRLEKALVDLAKSDQDAGARDAAAKSLKKLATKP